MDGTFDASRAMRSVPDTLFWLRPISPAARVGTAWLAHVADLGIGVTSFAADRIREDNRTRAELLKCRSVPEIQHVQAKFVQTAIDQYLAETVRWIGVAEGLATQKRKPRVEV